MNFSDFKIFYEAINVPPHLPRKWWKETFSKAAQLEPKFIGKRDLVKEYDVLAEDEYGFESVENIYYQLPGNFRRMIEKSEWSPLSPLTTLMKEYLEVVETEGLAQKIITNARDRIDMIGTYNLDFSKFIKDWSYYKRDSAEDKSVSDLDHALEMSNNHKIVLEVKEMFDSIVEYIKLLRSTKKYVDALKERAEIVNNRYGWTDKSNLSPKHKEKEILYHATPFIKEILEHGFKTKEELGGKEMLGGDTQNAISFTADIRIAQSIATALRDVIDIAHGKINIGYIVKLAKSEGINVKEFEEWILNMKNRAYRMQALSGKRPNYWNHVYDERFDSLKEKAFDLYKAYLYKTEMRYNPLFFGVSVKNFEGLSKDNVGVLACRVNMSTNIRYLQSMEEFRIPPKGILKIVKVFR